MKRIYAFTLKTDGPTYDEKFSGDLRLIAYMLYETIYGSRDGDLNFLNVNKNIRYNMLNEKYDGYSYRFNSDLDDDGITYYEPFIVGEDTFCFTVFDDLINEEAIRYFLKNALSLVRLDYEIDIISVSYYSRNKDDERCREKAIKYIHDTLGIEYVKRNSLVRRLLNRFGKNN